MVKTTDYFGARARAYVHKLIHNHVVLLALIQPRLRVQRVATSCNVATRSVVAPRTLWREFDVREVWIFRSINNLLIGLWWGGGCSNDLIPLSAASSFS